MTRPISLELVVCTYDNAGLLDRTLAAMARQRVEPGVRWGVVVVDNNCTDDTPAVVERHAASFPAPLRRVVEARQGLTAARARGVRESAADWIAFIDDDCLLEENWVREAARFAREHPECGAFGGRVVLAWETAPPPWVAGYGWAFAETELGDLPHRRDWLAGAGMVLRRAALVQTGWTDRQLLEDRIGRRLVSGGDVEIGLRIAARFDVWYHPGCVLHHVIPPHRTTRAYLRRVVFGLGASANAADALSWRHSYPVWLAHSARGSATLLARAVRRMLGDLRYQPAAFDPPSALAFTFGWWAAMWRTLREPAWRRAVLGALARDAITTVPAPADAALADPVTLESR